MHPPHALHHVAFWILTKLDLSIIACAEWQCEWGPAYPAYCPTKATKRLFKRLVPQLDNLLTTEFEETEVLIRSMRLATQAIQIEQQANQAKRHIGMFSKVHACNIEQVRLDWTGLTVIKGRMNPRDEPSLSTTAAHCISLLWVVPNS